MIKVEGIIRWVFYSFKFKYYINHRDLKILPDQNSSSHTQRPLKVSYYDFQFRCIDHKTCINFDCNALKSKFMNEKFLYIKLIFSLAVLFVGGCNSNEQPGKENIPPVVSKTDTIVISQGINSKGIGRFKKVMLSHPLDQEMITKGQSVFESKCVACHKLTDEKLVGPGWKGVTERRTPEWIMNFTTNTQVMLDKDLVAQSEMATCIVRMPNQDLTDNQARQILEFMRKNDGKN